MSSFLLLPPSAKTSRQANFVSSLAMSCPSLRAMLAMDRSMMQVEIGNSIAAESAPKAPPAVPEPKANALCNRSFDFFPPLLPMVKMANCSPFSKADWVISLTFLFQLPGRSLRPISMGLPSSAAIRAVRLGYSSRHFAACRSSRSDGFHSTFIGCCELAGTLIHLQQIQFRPQQDNENGAFGQDKYQKIALDSSEKFVYLLTHLGRIGIAGYTYHCIEGRVPEIFKLGLTHHILEQLMQPAQNFLPSETFWRMSS